MAIYEFLFKEIMHHNDLGSTGNIKIPLMLQNIEYCSYNKILQFENLRWFRGILLRSLPFHKELLALK